jgi:hypothetical protein
MTQLQSLKSAGNIEDAELATLQILHDQVRAVIKQLGLVVWLILLYCNCLVPIFLLSVNARFLPYTA